MPDGRRADQHAPDAGPAARRQRRRARGPNTLAAQRRNRSGALQSTDVARHRRERRAPAGQCRPILLVAGIGLVAVVALVVSLFRDPGLPAYVQDSYMRVAGGLVRPTTRCERHGPGATLSQAPPGAVRVPALDTQDYSLDGGTHVTLGGTPAALAIYHNALRDLVTWHGVAGTLDDLPPTPDQRVLGGRRYALHYKATTTIVFWQEGPILMAITSALPAEHVMAIALAASAARDPDTIRAARRPGAPPAIDVGATASVGPARHGPHQPRTDSRYPCVRPQPACGRGQPFGRARAQLCRRVGDPGRLRQLRGDAGRPADRRGLHPAAEPPARGVDAPRDCRGQARAVREADGAGPLRRRPRRRGGRRAAASPWPKRSCTGTIR